MLQEVKDITNGVKNRNWLLTFPQCWGSSSHHVLLLRTWVPPGRLHLRHTSRIKSWQLTNELSAWTGSKKNTRLGEECELFVYVCNHTKGIRRAELAACWHLHMQGVSLPEHLWCQMWFNPHLSSQHTFLKRVKHQHSMPYQMLALS